jgi:hypothetical protein
LPRLPLNLDPPDLCLLSSWDYRRKPLAGTRLKEKNVLNLAGIVLPPHGFMGDLTSDLIWKNKVILKWLSAFHTCSYWQ